MKTGRPKPDKQQGRFGMPAVAKPGRRCIHLDFTRGSARLAMEFEGDLACRHRQMTSIVW